MSNVSIQVIDQDTGLKRATEAGPLGDYEVPNLRPGTYRIEARAPGFKMFEHRDVVLGAGQTVRADVTLEIGQLSDTVRVTAEPLPLIQLESQAILSGLDRQELEALPRLSRDFQSFLYLNPNVVGDRDHGFQFLGGRTYGVSYLQDGQPSTGGIFGGITNAGPGLDAIAEIQVLSNSYGTEFGGLGAVVLTTRRGGNRYAGTGFYDFNADELNALTYSQTLAGVTRGDSGLNTYDYRFGANLGGPIKSGRTFFFLNYEGGNRTEIGGGAIVPVPTERMRRGDFSLNNFILIDPQTGQPFPGNVIPPNRLSEAAHNVLDFFYPPANLPPLSNGIGRSQEFVELASTMHRWDGRIDHELSNRDSLFGRVSSQWRKPGTFFENANFPALGIQNRDLTAHTLAGSWTRTVSSRALSELRLGYNTERSTRQSRYLAREVADSLGLQIPPRGLERRGYPAFAFQGSNTIRSIADPSQDANRDIRQSTFALSHTTTWLRGRHSIKFGGTLNQNRVLDGFSLGVSGAAGSFTFTGAHTGNSFGDFLLGLPARSDEGINTRGVTPLDASAREFALFIQDDWKVQDALTVFLGLRYEVFGNFVERNNLLINFNPKSGALALPAPEIADFLSPEARALPLEVAADLDLGRALVNADGNNFSPRLGLAYRMGKDNRTVLRGGLGYFYPANAAQGIRDSLSRSPFRYALRRTDPVFAQAFSTGTLSSRALFGVNAVDFRLESPEALHYHVTLERELLDATALRVSFLGTRFRKLLVNRDINTVPPSTTFFDLDNPVDRQRLPYPNLDPFLNMVENAGSGWFRAWQVEMRRRLTRGLAFDAAYTFADTESTAPDLGNSTLGVVQYAPYDLSLDRGPDPDIVKHRLLLNSTWQIPIGRPHRFFSTLPRWADLLIGGWTLATIFQARSGQHLTPFFAYGTSPVFPANTGKAYDTNNSFTEAWRPDIVGDPNGSRQRQNFFNLRAFKLPDPGGIGNTRKGILIGPGTWVVNVGIYKTIARAGGYAVEFRATLDNALNHPQFFVANDSGFLDLTDFLINGLVENGTTNSLAGEVANVEGFSPGRIVRLGARVTF